MLYLADECKTMAKLAPAFYINMGTAMPFYAETLPRTARALFANQKPWVLDPVGIGLSEMRTQILNQLKIYKPSIVRGNASEIIALAKLWGLLNTSETEKFFGVVFLSAWFGQSFNLQSAQKNL